MTRYYIEYDVTERRHVSFVTDGPGEAIEEFWLAEADRSLHDRSNVLDRKGPTGLSMTDRNGPVVWGERTDLS